MSGATARQDVLSSGQGDLASGTSAPENAPGAPSSRHRRRLSWRGPIERLVVLYMLAALGAFVVCGVALALAQRHAALQEGVRDARTTTGLLAGRVVEPALPTVAPASLGSDQDFDEVMRGRVLGAPLTQARILDETGLVVYATDAGSAGQREPLSPAQLGALRDAGTAAERDDGSNPVSLFGDRDGHALEVVAGLRSPSGQPLLLQTSQPFEVVWVTSRAVWLTLLPSLVLALVLLYLVKIGFTYRLTRGLRGVQDEREQLLVAALAAGDRERAQIASDLHDGVVQGLTGASYTLTDSANRSRGAGQPELADTLAETARSLRQWVRELRSLIVTVTPPALHSEGLQATLSDLTATLEARRVAVELDVRTSEDTTEEAESLVYRVAQEAVRNIVRHAHASHVRLEVVEEAGVLRLEVRDDGDGFDPSRSSRRQGSVGLPLLAALVHERGGRLRVTSVVGEGTTVTLRLPLRPGPR